jgi:PAS domain S-box-containing protein
MPAALERFDIEHLALLTNKLTEKMQELADTHRSLADSVALCHSIIQTAGSVILYLSTDYRIVEWNQEAERLYGLQCQEVLGKNYLELCVPAHLRGAVAADLGTVLSGEPRWGLEHLVGAADGRQRMLSWNIDRLLNPSGEPIGIVAVGQDISERKAAEAQLRENSERLQTLTRRLLEVQEEERRHLSRELHDEIGQVMATITLHLHAARGLAGEAAMPRLDECALLMQQAGEQVRSLALELRPTMLDTLGLEAALRWLAEHHQKRTGCVMQIVGRLHGAPLSPEMVIAYYRVAQEALTNIVRHAAARHVWIELIQSESVLELVVRDDGVGFDVAAARERAGRGGRLGLLGMAERVQLLGGSLHVECVPAGGTRICAVFPLGNVSEQQAKPKE